MDAGAPRGRVIILPGLENVSFHLYGLARRIERRYPGLDATVRTWGPPLMLWRNLRSYDRNLERARQIADEIATWRRAHPRATVDLIGLSGGGAMALLVAEALPEDVQLDRVILLAPAIAHDYPLDRLMPRIRECVVNFTSALDLHVGWGTRWLGTIDRKYARSAGSLGFDRAHPGLLEVPWSADMISDGHLGFHYFYVVPWWQDRYVLPLLDRPGGCKTPS